jgi:hypothetical protein
LTLALSWSRARVLCRDRFEHPWRVELALGCAALCAAGLVVSHDLRGFALATWTYWLVQSAFFLVRTRAGQAEARGAPDPFDAAVQRASQLMDDPL